MAKRKPRKGVSAQGVSPRRRGAAARARELANRINQQAEWIEDPTAPGRLVARVMERVDETRTGWGFPSGVTMTLWHQIVAAQSVKSLDMGAGMRATVAWHGFLESYPEYATAPDEGNPPPRELVRVHEAFRRRGRPPKKQTPDRRSAIDVFLQDVLKKLRLPKVSRDKIERPHRSRKKQWPALPAEDQIEFDPGEARRRLDAAKHETRKAREAMIERNRTAFLRGPQGN